MTEDERKELIEMMEYNYEVGKEYKTLGGYIATVLDVNYNGGGEFKIAGKINKGGLEYIITWKSDGSYNILNNSHPYDLMPPVETMRRWRYD